MVEQVFAAAAERNSEPILEALRHEFRGYSDVLEIGSGTGQHAVFFSAALTHLDWQTSDLDENHEGIRGWIRASGLHNVRAPLSLDVCRDDVAPAAYDAVFSSNTAHIMSLEAVERMISSAALALRGNGVFCLYGPFREGGCFNTDSNRRFDASLRGRDRRMGIRDLEALDDLSVRHGMHRTGLYAMPSNNLLVVWKKEQETTQ